MQVVPRKLVDLNLVFELERGSERLFRAARPGLNHSSAAYRDAELASDGVVDAQNEIAFGPRAVPELPGCMVEYENVRFVACDPPFGGFQLHGGRDREGGGCHRSRTGGFGETEYFALQCFE